ncbi:MAG TPA: DUF1385 domain-containing protein [Gaiellaceae bacterium]|nr:DUF1385 domain-containing protein [Gaiellaceae bacterium]
MSRDKVRLGGMALGNGVLVHGPRYWACAIRLEDGGLEVASGLKPLRAAEIENRLIRTPARLAEVFALLPEVRRRLPAAQLPFQRPAVAAAMVGSAAAVKAVRGSRRLSSAAQEGLAALLAVAPAAVAMRGSNLAEYHGAEHISIGTYEHGEDRAKEHERCGSHMLGPLLLTSAVGNALAARAPATLRPAARAAAGLGAIAASIELFSWMVQNEKNPLARALAVPGHELQHRFVTAEPSQEQLEVANLALEECLRLESPANGDNRAAEEAPPT